jgi:hypothetical protein
MIYKSIIASIFLLFLLVIVNANEDWGGFNRPGWVDPNDPWHNDWHCDRYGSWHNDEHDQWGHPDSRCHKW